MLALRRAVPADRAVVEFWDSQPDVASWAGSDGPWDWETELGLEDPAQEMFIITEDDEPRGFLQLLDAFRDPHGYWGPGTSPGTWAVDLWIGEAVHRQRGLGAWAMQQALEQAFEHHGASEVVIDPLLSNHDAIRFYRRCGFEIRGERRFGNDDCLVLGITTASWSTLSTRTVARGPEAE